MKTCVLALAFLMIAVACPFTSHAAELPRVTLCVPLSLTYAQVYVAQREGFFQQEGLDVKVDTTTNAKLCNDSVVAKHADAAMEGEGPFTWISFAEPPLRLVAQVASSSETKLIARRDSGIKSVADLRGKRIGYLPASASYLFLVRLLEQQGLLMKDIRTIALQPQAMPKALQGGGVDAVVIWEPWAEQAATETSEQTVLIADPSIYTFHTSLVVGQQFATDHPERVRALLAAMLKAEDFIKKNPDDVAKASRHNNMIDFSFFFAGEME